MNKKIMETLGFGKEVERKENNRCPFCNCKVDLNMFKDELSKKEFEISGLCQNCQDETFN